MQARIEALERDLADARADGERTREELEAARRAAEEESRRAAAPHGKPKKEKASKRERRRKRKAEKRSSPDVDPTEPPWTRRTAFTIATGIGVALGLAPAVWASVHMEDADETTFLWTFVSSIALVMAVPVALAWVLRAPGRRSVFGLSMVTSGVPVGMLLAAANPSTYDFVPEGAPRQIAAVIGTAVVVVGGATFIALQAASTAANE